MSHDLTYTFLDRLAADAERRADDLDALREFEAAWCQLIQATIRAGAARRRLVADVECALRLADERREAK